MTTDEIKAFKNIEKHIPKNQVCIIWAYNKLKNQLCLTRDISQEYCLYLLDKNKLSKIKQSKNPEILEKMLDELSQK